MKILRSVFKSVPFLIFIGVSLGFALNTLTEAQRSQSPAQIQAVPVLKFGDPLPANAFVELAKLVNPAVVNISTMTKPKQRFGYRDPFYDMLERFYGIPVAPGGPQARPAQALGTGFVIRKDGLIVTNNHVIAGADTINVQLSENGEKLYPAKLIGSDDRTDIALIKITSDNDLPTVQLGSSKELMVGEWVAAFGNPYGQGHTMTKGIISAKGRDISEINRFPLLQTDTPINPGNSGGPLVNMKGQVIGVNSAIDARAQGIGFAIPIDEVKNIIPQLEKNGRIKKGYLGVGLENLDPQSAMYLGLGDITGAFISGVERNSPAAKGGLRPYDVIVEFNGKKVKSADELRDAVADAEIGSSAKVKVFREGKEKDLNVKVAERPDMSKAPKTEIAKAHRGEKAPYDLGFVVSDFNKELKKDFEISDEFNGQPVIVDILPGSLADRAGIRPGDVILDVNKKEVASASDVLRQVKKGSNAFRLGRGDRLMVIVIN